MGVQLTDLIPRNEISIEELKDKKLAIDASNCIYQFLASIRQRDGTPLMNSHGKITSHLVGLSSRITNLMNQGLKLCFVFDGKAPVLKIKEQEEREHRKLLAEKKLAKAKEEEDIESMYKYSKQTIRLTSEIIEGSKEFIKALGLPIIQAPSEAEAQAAFIAEKKDVFAVASTDYDSLIFGTPRLIRNLTISQRRRLPSGASVTIKPEIMYLDEVFKKLKLNKDKLLVLAILIGTDYNKGGVKGVGPKTALRLVQEYKDFNELFKEVKAEFNWKEIYAVFKSMPIMKNYQLKWQDPHIDKIQSILEKNDFSEERINKIIENLTKRKKSQAGLDKWV